MYLCIIFGFIVIYYVLLVESKPKLFVDLNYTSKMIKIQIKKRLCNKKKKDLLKMIEQLLNPFLPR